ncbi:MAG: endonuclease/exonuclease/phosphatase family protein [Candidatus Pelagadaptatus aseana]|uniref:endonuclease/exonuclease/phosphatase family protein n=1 Tax=Candidatus Pelagadaptatus aseana TaxID=3120508 RepID=UPI0039B19D6E
MNDFKVLTYNIHKGFNARNRQFILDEIRQAIRLTKADIVALQEVQGSHKGHAETVANFQEEAHFEYLADSVWLHNSYGKNAIYQQGHHGNAMLSKFPFHRTHNHDISQWWFSQRGILHGEIMENLHIACVHLGFLPYEQARQIRRLQHWLDDSVPPQDPVIIMGDFNDWHHRLHRFMTNKLGFNEASCYCSHSGWKKRPARTYPAHKPRLSMDRIYYRHLKLKSSDVLSGDPWNKLSDHCPITANFSYI